MSERPMIFVHGANMSASINYELICDLLQAYGINDLVVEIGYARYTRYPSAFVPSIFSDQLTPSINACHARGMKMHASFNILLGSLGVDRGLESYTGAIDGGFSCGLKMRTGGLMENLMKELATFPAQSGPHIGETIDGLMTDYLRFGEAEGRMDICYCPLHRAAFEAYLGEGPLNWTQFYPGGSRHAEFIAWRHIPYNDLARDIHDWAIAVNPNLEISSAVWPPLSGNPNRPKTMLGQDWGTWVQNGWVDWVAPMIYTTDTNIIAAIMQEILQSLMPGKPALLMPFMANAWPGTIPVTTFVAEIDALRANGSDGWVVWRYGGQGDGTVTAPDLVPYLDLLLGAGPPPPPQYVTPFSELLDVGSYRITFPSNVIVGADTYNFVQWNDGDTNPVKIIDLITDITLNADYQLQTPPPQKAYLDVHAFLDGTEVIAEGKIVETGQTFQTPATIEVNPGAYTIELTLQGVTRTITANVADGETLRVDGQFAPPTPPDQANLGLIAVALIALFALTQKRG